MYPLIEPPKNFADWNIKSREVLSKLMSATKSLAKPVQISENQTLSFSNPQTKAKSIYFVTQGSISCFRGETLILLFESGDLVGLPHQFCIEGVHFGSGD